MSTPASHPAITGVDFVTIPSTDLAESSAFYRDVLGLRRSVYVPDRHFSEYEAGPLTLSVINSAGMGFEHYVNHNPVALHVDDVDAARAVLEAHGVRFNGDTIDTGVCHMAFFADPDGNALMLHHRYAPRVTEAG
jgi:catechol 2,3-dioxygenase-like lactoylglutathione lyase family enzyme